MLLAALPLAAQMSPPQTVKGLKTVEGLETTIFAAEPLVANPTNIDIDEKGRIWYLEAVNYRALPSSSLSDCHSPPKESCASSYGLRKLCPTTVKPEPSGLIRSAVPA